MEDWLWVDETTKVRRFCEEVAKVTVVGVDTEYDSFRYFREKLCLIQICVGSTTYLFDPLGSLDLAFLGTIFADHTVVKVLHAGDNDIRILRRDYNFTFHNVFDTYRAAVILGYAHLSLANLIHHLLGIDVGKERKIQRSQWDVRPLSPHQIVYAVRDAAYLEELYRRLDGLL
ncbi:MAG: ribonuclease D, partial [Syntrophales bacterium]|nr:ribonuclease D [Syntrophales bacterium]